MPKGNIGIAAIWVAAQIALTLLLKLAYKLAENAVIGWGDDQISVYFGINAPRVIAFLSEWGAPFLSSAVALLLLHWYYTKRNFRPPESPIAAKEVLQIHRPVTPRAVAPIKTGLYVAEVRFDFSRLKADRYGELIIRLFNGTGNTIRFSGVDGNLKFVCGDEIVKLPTPALKPENPYIALPFSEWQLVFSQQVPAIDADKLLALKQSLKRSGSKPIIFWTYDLTISVAEKESQNSEKLPLWHGFSYSQDCGFSRVIIGSMAATESSDSTRGNYPPKRDMSMKEAFSLISRYTGYPKCHEQLTQALFDGTVVASGRKQKDVDDPKEPLHHIERDYWLNGRIDWTTSEGSASAKTDGVIDYVGICFDASQVKQHVERVKNQ